MRIYEEVRALAGRGVVSEIVTYPIGADPPGLTVRRAPRLPGVRVRAVGPGYTRPLVDATLLATALSTAKRFKPDLIHAHLHEGIAIGAVLRRRLALPLVADLQGSLVGELVDHGFLSTGSMSASVVARAERWLVRQPDAILASSTSALELLRSQGADPRRLVWFPDGVDLKAFRPLPIDRALEASFGLSGKRTVVFLGLLTSYQGVDLLHRCGAGCLARGAVRASAVDGLSRRGPVPCDGHGARSAIVCDPCRACPVHRRRPLSVAWPGGSVAEAVGDRSQRQTAELHGLRTGDRRERHAGQSRAPGRCGRLRAGQRRIGARAGPERPSGGRRPARTPWPGAAAASRDRVFVARPRRSAVGDLRARTR